MTQSRSWKWRYHWLKLRRHGLENILKSISPCGRFKNCEPFQPVEFAARVNQTMLQLCRCAYQNSNDAKEIMHFISKSLLLFIKDCTFVVAFSNGFVRTVCQFSDCTNAWVVRIFLESEFSCKIANIHEICRLLQFTLPKTHIHVWKGTFRSIMGLLGVHVIFRGSNKFIQMLFILNSSQIGQLPSLDVSHGNEVNIFVVFNFVWSMNHFSPFFFSSAFLRKNKQVEIVEPEAPFEEVRCWRKIRSKFALGMTSDDLFIIFFIKGNMKSFGLMKGLFFPSTFSKYFYIFP